MERIRRAGYSEVLLEFANRQKCRDINKEVQKKELKDPQLSITTMWGGIMREWRRRSRLC